MTHVIAAALHDAEAGFLKYHARPGFWIACVAIAGAQRHVNRWKARP